MAPHPLPDPPLRRVPLSPDLGRALCALLTRPDLDPELCGPLRGVLEERATTVPVSSSSWPDLERRLARLEATMHTWDERAALEAHRPELLCALGEPEAALELATARLATLGQRGGSGLQLAGALEALGRVRYALGAVRVAERLLSEALHLREAAGESREDHRALEALLAEVLEALGHRAEARGLRAAWAA